MAKTEEKKDTPADDAPAVNANTDPAAAAALHPDGIAGPGRSGGVVVADPVAVSDAEDAPAVIGNDEFGRSMAPGVSR